MAHHGHFVWSELITRMVDKAGAFYSQVLGWTIEKIKVTETEDYVLAKIGNQPVAGILDITGQPGTEQMPDHSFAYIEVDDVDGRVAKVAGAGGTVVRPPMTVPDVGRIAVIQDATGAMIGLMTSDPAMAAR